MHDHNDPDLEGIPQEVLEAYNGIWDRLKGLDSELRNLFIDEATLKIKAMLTSALEEGDMLKVKSLIAVADNSLNLIGMTNAQESASHEEWTSTGDKRVGLIWNDWIGLVTNMVASATSGFGTVPISAEDLPPETIERLSDGNPTTEDLELVKAAMRKSGAEVPDGIDVEFAGIVGTKEEAMALAKSFAEKKGDEPDKGYGLYL